MMRVIFIIVPALILAFIIFLSLQYFGSYGSKKGALQVTSSPESKVYLDDKYIGQTPLCKCEKSDVLKTGDYTIRLVPVDTSLAEFQEKITISESVLTVIDRKFGKDSLSEGSVISLTPLADKKKLELLVVSFPEGSSIWLDNNLIGNTPFLYKTPTESDHVLKVRKNGYKEKTIRIHPPMGYKLTAAVYLSTGTDVADQTPSVTPAPTVAPSQAVPQVVILDTPTGFLRVRENPSAGATEVARVSPGDTYPLVDEADGWYKIKLTDGTLGWISLQYARKQ